MRVFSVNVGVPREVSWTHGGDRGRVRSDCVDGPARRAADPEEIAAAIVFPGSDMASYVSGAVIPVDGGHIAVAGVYQSLAKEPA